MKTFKCKQYDIILLYSDLFVIYSKHLAHRVAVTARLEAGAGGHHCRAVGQEVRGH